MPLRYFAMSSEADFDDHGCNVLAWSFLGRTDCFSQLFCRPSHGFQVNLVWRSQWSKHVSFSFSIMPTEMHPSCPVPWMPSRPFATVARMQQH